MGDTVRETLEFLLKKIDNVQKELEEVRILVLKLIADSLPEEELDEETLKALEKDLQDMIEGKVETLSAEEFIKMLSENEEE